MKRLSFTVLVSDRTAAAARRAVAHALEPMGLSIENSVLTDYTPPPPRRPPSRQRPQPHRAMRCSACGADMRELASEAVKSLTTIVYLCSDRTCGRQVSVGANAKRGSRV